MGFGRTLAFGILFANSVLWGAGASPGPGFHVSGTVFDQSGAVVQRASVRLFSLDQALQTKSDDRGRFVFTELLAGVYELQADYPGSDTTIENVIVSQDMGPCR